METQDTLPYVKGFDALPDRSMRTVVEVLEMLVRNYLTLVAGTDPANEEDLTIQLKELWGNVRFVYNFPMLNDKELQDIWDTKFRDQWLMDFVMNIVIDLRFYIGEELWTDTIANAAKAMAAFTIISKNTDKIIDPIVTQRMASQTYLQNRLASDPWILIVYLMRMVDRSVFHVPAPQKSKR